MEMHKKRFPMKNSEELRLEGDWTEEPQDVLLYYMNDDADFDNRVEDYQGSGDGKQDHTSLETNWKSTDLEYEKIQRQFGDSVHHVIPRKLDIGISSAELNLLRPVIGQSRREEVRVVLGEEAVQYTYHPTSEIVSGGSRGVEDCTNRIAASTTEMNGLLIIPQTD